MSTAPYRSYVSISRARIAANFREVRDAVGPGVEAAAVVKDDDYGQGAMEVSRVIELAGGRWLGAGSVEEGVALRRCGRTSRILVLAGFLNYEREALLEFDLTPAVHSLEEIASLDKLGKNISYHLKIDSGMGRLGTRASSSERVAAVRAATSARCEGLMTHFASAADYGSLQTEHHSAPFPQMRDMLKQAGITPAYFDAFGTNAIAYPRREDWHNLVRSGHAIYGYLSPARGEAPARILHVKPALEWKAKILAVKDVPGGALGGY